MNAQSYLTSDIDGLPQLERSSIIPDGYFLDYDNLLSENDHREMKKAAVAIVEHMEIVRESRKLAASRKGQTWEEFVVEYDTGRKAKWVCCKDI